MASDAHRDVSTSAHKRHVITDPCQIALPE